MIYRVMRAGWTAVCDDGIEVVHHNWRSEDEERLAHRAYGMGFIVQTVKHARAGDAVALRMAAAELLDHVWWTLVALVHRDRRGLGYQSAWTHGVLSGLAISRRWPPGAARS